MLIERALNRESSYEIFLKLNEKSSKSISYSGQIVFFQFLHYTCFSSAICLLQVSARTKPSTQSGVALICFISPFDFITESHRIVVRIAEHACDDALRAF